MVNQRTNSEVLERRKNIVDVMSQNEDFIIIGLTGRLGSGCTEAAKIFGSSYLELGLPKIEPGTQGLSDNQERERRILQRYAGAHWLKFDVIRSREIISSFLLDDIQSYLWCISHLDIKSDMLNSPPPPDERFNKENKKILSFIRKSLGLTETKVSPIVIGRNESQYSNALKLNNLLTDFSDAYQEYIKKNQPETYTLQCITDKAKDALSELSHSYEAVDNGMCMNERSRYLASLESVLERISKAVAHCMLFDLSDEELWIKLQDINNKIKTQFVHQSLPYSRIEQFAFVHDIMPAVGNAVRSSLQENSQFSYTEIFQKFGNSIRCYGRIAFFNDERTTDLNVFAIPERIVQFIKVLRHPFESGTRPTRVVIDSIKNVFESRYLRQRYSSFYLIAISADDEIRRMRLMNSNGKSLTLEAIRMVDWNEYSSDGCNIYRKLAEDAENGEENLKMKYEADEISFYEHISAEHGWKSDFVRKKAYDIELHQFYLQDVAAAIEDADVFISNNHTGEITKNFDLRWSIVRNVCLIMFPGLVQPTPIERCMQIAFSAKCNSGCLSRQVGAVVADKNYNIISTGWNDVPCGDIPCSLKNLVDLDKAYDQPAYTKYELENPDLRNRIRKFYNSNQLSARLRGLPMRYCFKDLHQTVKNPMRSRAMHAEEKALAACTNAAEGGYLFTTSSPCEMCSKNAKNHRIKKIYYIELYPGISETQYSDSGTPDNRAEHILFTGAIGRAYTQMYTPIMPQKDILDLLGMRESSWSNNPIIQSDNTDTKPNNADEGVVFEQSPEDANASTPNQPSEKTAESDIDIQTGTDS